MPADPREHGPAARRYQTDPKFHQLVHFMVQVLSGFGYEDLQAASALAVDIITEREARDGRPAAVAAARPCHCCGQDVPPDYAAYLRTFPADDPRR